MAKKSRETFQKRNKEKARQQKQNDKAARRLEAKKRRASGESDIGDTPLDTAGILTRSSAFPSSGGSVSDPV